MPGFEPLRGVRDRLIVTLTGAERHRCRSSSGATAPSGWRRAARIGPLA